MNDPYETPETDIDPVEKPREISLNWNLRTVFGALVGAFIGMTIGITVYAVIDLIVFYGIAYFRLLDDLGKFFPYFSRATFIILVTGGGFFGWRFGFRIGQNLNSS